MTRWSVFYIFCSLLFSINSVISLWESSGNHHFLESLEENSSNGTCIYITILDQFGDGWGEDSSLYYWVEESSSIGAVKGKPHFLKLTTCNTSHMYGCLPTLSDIDHLTHLELVTVDSNTGVGYVPAFFWEILWRVELIFQHRIVGEYYGGYNSAFVFRYIADRAENVLVRAENQWNFPEIAGDNPTYCNDDPIGLGDSRVRKTGTCSEVEISTSGRVNSDGVPGGNHIHRSVGWYISDNEADSFYNLHDYGLPWSSTDSSPLTCSVCLPDGLYTFRTTGFGHNTDESLTWSFCGASGSIQTHMEFTMLEGRCIAHHQAGVRVLCDGSEKRMLTDSCVHYDAAPCATSGECGEGFCNNGYCACYDMEHYWPRERCSTRHDGPQLAPGQFCNPNVNNAYCSYMGTCNSEGTACICNEHPHRYSSERCAHWHETGEQSPTPSPVTAGIIVSPSPSPNACYTGSDIILLVEMLTNFLRISCTHSEACGQPITCAQSYTDTKAHNNTHSCSNSCSYPKAHRVPHGCPHPCAYS